MSTCSSDSEFDGSNMGARIASVFVVLVLSGAGSFLPLLASKFSFLGYPEKVLFVTRYFGSGVIVATAFIHLLGESVENLSSTCLPSGFREFPVATALALGGAVTMFTIEVVTHRSMDRAETKYLDEELGCSGPSQLFEPGKDQINHNESSSPELTTPETEIESEPTEVSEKANMNQILKALVNIYLLEFGIVFHSVFVGLSLAISGDEFKTLFIAVSFHQFFEGLGLGSRFATAVWPSNLSRMPWYLSLAYTLTTPAAIGVGLGIRNLYSANSPTSLIVVGIFDGFCSGLLIYNCMVELMARDFNQDRAIRGASNKRFLVAYVMFLLGIALMALLGQWA